MFEIDFEIVKINFVMFTVTLKMPLITQNQSISKLNFDMGIT